LPFDDYARGNVQLKNPIKLARESWALVYNGGNDKDFATADKFWPDCQKAQGRMKIQVDEPQYVEVHPAKGRPNAEDFIKAIKAEINPKSTKFVVVLLPDKNLKKGIKALLDQGNIPSQFVLNSTLFKGSLSVYSNILKQINAKLAQDLYALQMASSRNTMVIGVDICLEGRKSILGFAASYTEAQT